MTAVELVSLACILAALCIVLLGAVSALIWFGIRWGKL